MARPAARTHDHDDLSVSNRVYRNSMIYTCEMTQELLQVQDQLVPRLSAFLEGHATLLRMRGVSEMACLAGLSLALHFLVSPQKCPHPPRLVTDHESGLFLLIRRRYALASEE